MTCEHCEEAEAVTRFRSAKVCAACETDLETEEKQFRGHNDYDSDDYETDDY